MPSPLSLEKQFTKQASPERQDLLFVHGENPLLYPQGKGRASASWDGTIEGKYLLNAYCVQEVTRFSTGSGKGSVLHLHIKN